MKNGTEFEDEKEYEDKSKDIATVVFNVSAIPEIKSEPFPAVEVKNENPPKPEKKGFLFVGFNDILAERRKESALAQQQAELDLIAMTKHPKIMMKEKMPHIKSRFYHLEAEEDEEEKKRRKMSDPGIVQL